MTVRISEYYDLFDIKRKVTDLSTGIIIGDSNNPLPNNQQSTNSTNPFSGFNNLPIGQPGSSIQQYQPPPNEPSQYISITGQHKAPQAVTNIRIDDDGSVWCYPPNVSVPYWNRIVFRHYDYTVSPQSSSKLRDVCRTFNDNMHYSIYPTYDYNGIDDRYEPIVDESDGAIKLADDQYNYSTVPLFVRYDEYPSRSKVVFSKGDIIKGADIEFRFGYHKGQMEPIKLNLSMSCNNYINDGTYTYNQQLTLDDIEKTLVKCNFSIEWIYERETGN